MRGVVSKSGGNASLAGERKVWRTLNGHEGESRTQPRGTCSHRSEPGGQGVHREVESEGPAEKYRAVVDGGHPVTNRSAKGGARSSPHYGGEGVLIHPPYQGVCGRHGMADHDVTPGGLDSLLEGTKRSNPISDSEVGSGAGRVVGPPHSTLSVAKAT